MKRQIRLYVYYVRKYSFSQRTVNDWDKLSADCVHSGSINMFKNKINNYLVSRSASKARIHLDGLPI